MLVMGYDVKVQVDGEEMLSPDPKLFYSIVKGVQTKLKDLETPIKLYLKKSSQDTERNTDTLILSMLYCGAYELMAHDDVDAPIIISDYIHIARSFYEGAQAKLVNAVLDNMKLELRS